MQTKKINLADMLPIEVKGVNLLAIKTDSDVKMTDNGKCRMVNESQVRTFNCMTRRVRLISCARACNLRSDNIRWWTSCMFQ